MLGRVNAPSHRYARLGAWTLAALGIGAVAGTASAAFLGLLDAATRIHQNYPALLWGLPFVGAFVGLVYARWAGTAERGTNLLIDAIEEPDHRVPFRMAPLVLVGTLITHVCGGSAGREGTAVQMGGALAARVTRGKRFSESDRRLLLVAGIAAGFASVFGTPLAGMIFALEVPRLGRLRAYFGSRRRSRSASKSTWPDEALRAPMFSSRLWPAFVAALAGHFTTLAWGIQHSHYPHIARLPFQVEVLASLLAAGLAFGALARLFTLALHAVERASRAAAARLPGGIAAWRPAIGGAAVIGATFAFGTHRYLGLGLPVISAAFTDALSWTEPLLKTLFTALTLGSGFKGGEVTPLFFVGATAGSALSHWLPLPTPTLAALGFAAVFAGASNTPLASTVLALELFGAELAWAAALCCGLAYLVSGRRSIYAAQRAHGARPATHGDSQ